MTDQTPPADPFGGAPWPKGADPFDVLSKVQLGPGGPRPFDGSFDQFMVRRYAGERWAGMRREIPRQLAMLGEIVIDNPGPVILTVSGIAVLTRLAERAVRPRTLWQAVATGLVTSAAAGVLFREAVKRELLDFRLRDDDGSYTKLSALLREAPRAPSPVDPPA